MGSCPCRAGFGQHVGQGRSDRVHAFHTVPTQGLVQLVQRHRAL